MSRETSSTARTLPEKIFVRFLTSTRGIHSGSRERNVSQTLQWQLLVRCEPATTASPRRNHRHGCQGRQETDKLPSAEVLFQNDSCQQHRNSGIQRSDHNRLIKAAMLHGEDKQGAGCNVEKAS